jgi:hypothetical protein
MKRPIQFLLTETYQSMTPEDAEFGEPSSQGSKEEVLSLEDLSSYLDKEGFIHPSESPITNGRVWISTESEITDYGTGESKIKSLHCKKVMDGDGIEIAGPQANRIWMKMVAKASGQKLDKNIHSMSP